MNGRGSKTTPYGEWCQSDAVAKAESAIGAPPLPPGSRWLAIALG